MQDGVTSHRIKEVFKTLFKVFCKRVIGLRYPKFANVGKEWPSFSPDFDPLDFFSWGYIKNKCYKDMLHRVFSCSKRRIQYCAQSNAAHFDKKLNLKCHDL